LYRFQKLVRRNKILFAAGAAVAVALIIGLGVSMRLYFLERAALQREVAAEQQAELARANEAKLRELAESREKITRANALVNDEDYDGADELIRQVTLSQPTVEGAAVFRSLGEYHALRNQWTEAADRFKVLLQIDQMDGWDACTLDYLRCGPALVEQGDVAGYERFRQAAVARFRSGTYPFADRIVKISLLLPAGQPFMKALAPLVDITTESMATNTAANDDVFLAAWRSVSLALVEYRSGHYDQAAEWCRQCLNYSEYIAPRTATAQIILAMSDQHLGKMQDARSMLAQAQSTIENKFKNELDRGTPVQGFWFDWVFARILLKEAEQLIDVPAAGG
jgi:tetratricopeptide (TPR) repeat protein